jgi:GntR family transcriptional regulator / MocR family aminotransferase
MNGHVIYLGNFSKVLFPGLRLGYLVLPPPLTTPFIRAKGLVDRGAPTLTQAAVADFIAEGHFELHLRHLRKAYKARRRALVTALETYLPGRVNYSPVAAGLHVMLFLHPQCENLKLWPRPQPPVSASIRVLPIIENSRHPRPFCWVLAGLIPPRLKRV